MKVFYGWVIVGAGIVITCLGIGTMMSLGIFLQPMSAATGWSRTGISTAALVHSASQSRGGTRLVGHGYRFDDGVAPRALDHHQLRLAHGDAGIGRAGLAADHSGRVARA